MVRPNQAVVVRHPDGYMVAVSPADEFDRADVLVRAFPWLFEQPVEQASAAPGEKRTTRRAQ